jgi:hypothetical protein
VFEFFNCKLLCRVLEVFRPDTSAVRNLLNFVFAAPMRFPQEFTAKRGIRKEAYFVIGEPVLLGEQLEAKMRRREEGEDEKEDRGVADRGRRFVAENELKLNFWDNGEAKTHDERGEKTAGLTEFAGGSDKERTMFGRENGGGIDKEKHGEESGGNIDGRGKDLWKKLRRKWKGEEGEEERKVTRRKGACRRVFYRMRNSVKRFLRKTIEQLLGKNESAAESVKVRCIYLPEIEGGSSEEGKKFLKMLTELEPNDKIFENEVLRHIIRYKWWAYGRKQFLFEFLEFFIFLLIFVVQTCYVSVQRVILDSQHDEYVVATYVLDGIIIIYDLFK